MNYKPEHKSKNLFFREFKKIINKSPYHSYIYGCVTKGRGFYEGTININFCQGQFQAHAREYTEDLLLNSLSTKLENQLQLWRKNRFNENIETTKYFKEDTEKSFASFNIDKMRELSMDSIFDSNSQHYCDGNI